MPLSDWVHLIKYDTNYGYFGEHIEIEEWRSHKEVTDSEPQLGKIIIGDQHIVVTAQRDPAKIPWAMHEVQTVIESTGVFNSRDKASAHLTAGAHQVILSAPAKGGDITTSVLGINDLIGVDIGSNASCTTNCVAPVAQIMHSVFGVKKALLTTIHSYTDDQNTQDNSHKKDLRRARTAAQNIIPTSTGAAIATTKVVPELQGLFDGLAVRVPTPVGSLSDLTFLVARTTTIDEINQAFTKASRDDRWQGILAVTNDPIVSSDVVGRRESSIVDLSLTQVIDGDLVKVVAWYDNEFGYCNRLVEQVGRSS